jgi:hypothetical protein
MSWRDWLLGRDTDDLTIVRGFRTVVWWVAWLNLAGVVVLFLLALQPPPPMETRPPFYAESLITYLMQAITPFLGWGFLTALLAIHDLFSGDEDENGDADDVEDDDEDRDDIEQSETRDRP